MKATILAVLLFPSLLIAQAPQPITSRPSRPPGLPSQSHVPADTLPDNYQITLIITDKDGQPVEVSVVVASTHFTAQVSEPVALNFSGSVALEESGALLVTYALGWETAVSVGNNNIQYKPSSTQGSVRLKVGEDVQVIRAGTRTARLSIKKLEAAKPK